MNHLSKDGRFGLCLALALSPASLFAQASAVERTNSLTVVEVKEPDGQILSYRQLSGSTEVRMRGTKLAPEAQIRLKVGARPGFTEIDINRGDIVNLKPARQFGKDFLTYVMWAVSVDGKASNLGEITFEGDRPISINVTTPYQTFWLMLTAEPDYAVVDPSSHVVLYSTSQGNAGDRSGTKPLPIKGDLYFFTHYGAYDASPGKSEAGPNALLQARKAVEMASKSGLAATGPRVGPAGGKEGERTRQALALAKEVLAQAEGIYQKNPQGHEVIQFARTAAQIAENARALAGGAVGNALARRLEDELAALRADYSKLQAELAGLRGAPAASPGPGKVAPVPTQVEEAPASTETPAMAKPVVWFGLVGWALAILLLFRRRSG